MFIKKETKMYKNGPKTYVRIVEGYRKNGKSMQRSIKSFGFIEDQVDKDAFMKMVNEELRILDSKKENDVIIKISSLENKLNGPSNIPYNYGYKYLETIYDFLKIDDFLNEYQKSLNGREKFKIADIFRFLVLERILYPNSKRSNVRRHKNYYGLTFDFTLDDVYRALMLIEPIYKDLQVHMRNQVSKLNIRKSNHLYYDVTNYYCEIDLNDLLEGLRKRGVSKEHRLSPIVGLGMFLDSNGLPMSFQVFPGNTAETKTLISGIDEVKKQNNIQRILCVADKGLNSLANILILISRGDGYLFSQIIKGPKGKRFSNKIFNEENEWVIKTDENGEVYYKYLIYTEKVKLGNGVEHEQKVLLYWSKIQADLAKKKRDEKVSRAKQSLMNNAYKIEHSYKKYLKKANDEKDVLEINYDLIEAESKYDGYFCLVTSETQMSESEMRQTYGSLWEIEDTFRVTKTNLEFRPIYHHKKETITAHFLTCFTALLVLRLFQYKLKENNIHLSPTRIVEVLKRMNVEKTSKDVYHLTAIFGSRAYVEFENNDGETIYTNKFSDEDQLEKDLKLIYIAFGVDMNLAYIKVEKFNKYLKSIKFHTTTA